jgi:hypothetical protein
MGLNKDTNLTGYHADLGRFGVASRESERYRFAKIMVDEMKVDGGYRGEKQRTRIRKAQGEPFGHYE